VFTFYTGAKLSTSTELLLDVEQAGGETLSRGAGLAAPANADFMSPVHGARPYVSRLVQNAAYDFPADATGYSWGAMTEFTSGLSALHLH
jgi:hypothetical protein